MLREHGVGGSNPLIPTSNSKGVAGFSAAPFFGAESGHFCHAASLDTNLPGVPTEGCGFSNDAKALIGTPPSSAASLCCDGKNLDMPISLHC
ncbi:MAG: DUF2141 domain-containing protein [Proteobacteria bacterium]|nr:DUF2141 domain-containing protein [Pseudomonadota bacterium]